MKSKIVFFIFLICAWWLLENCSSKVTTSTTPGPTGGKYSEDLSGLRPKIETTDTSKITGPNKNNEIKRDPSRYVESRHSVNESLDAVLDSIDRINQGHRVIDGFTIQFYSGLKREEALNVKKQLSTILPDIDADVQYVQPNFRVRAGKYINRVEAQKDYMAVKRHFPGAIVIPDRIPIADLKPAR